MTLLRRLLLITSVLLISTVATTASNIDSKKSFNIEFEKYVLDNGLEVILHEDHSDPIVAVATLVHVGSSREKPGRTGFAHFFEHMSFNDSENVPRGANRMLIPELGGSRNGGTGFDFTIYYEVVPKDAFEKIMWIDSDRLGYMINTVTKDALEREKQVVKNEKRQRVDNTAYGFTEEVIRKNLYPEGHPYSWTVIGSLPDLQAATLKDVKEFYDKYYGANNTTLVIAGDIDKEEVKASVDKWFSEIRRGPDVEPLTPRQITLNESKKLYMEDNFATLPKLTIVFPVPEKYHEDSYALHILARILSDSKKAPLYLSVVEKHKLAPAVGVENATYELAGDFRITVRANANTDLNLVKAAIEEGLADFEKNGFTDNDLQRIKAQIETSFYSGISTVLNKAFKLSVYNEFTGDPGYITVDANKIINVTKEDVMRVYEKYIKDKNFIMTSFVPKGQTELIVDGSVKAEVYIEEITEEASYEEVSQGEEAVYEKTVTVHDRSEPPLGKTPLMKSPEIWNASLSNGLNVMGIESSEIPLVEFELVIKGGNWFDPIDKPGVANLLSDLMMGGTADRTPSELEEAIGLLGASISVSRNKEELSIWAATLAKNYEATLALVEEILLEPRWDEKEFARLKMELETRLKGSESNPSSIAGVVFPKLLYGDEHIFGKQILSKNVGEITLDDLKESYKKLSPVSASFHVVGDVSKETVLASLEGLSEKWNTPAPAWPEYKLPVQNKGGKVYFVDVPGSRQSIVRVCKLALSSRDDNYNKLSYAIRVLGGGSSSRLFQTLRIEKGYAYSANIDLSNFMEVSPLIVSTSVRSNVTLESLEIIRDLISNYSATFDEEDMEMTKSMIIRSNTTSFESLDAKLNILNNINRRKLSFNYIEESQNDLLDMQLKDFHDIINTYLNEKEMIYVVVGDAATQYDNLEKLGLGKPIKLDIYGNTLEK